MKSNLKSYSTHLIVCIAYIKSSMSKIWTTKEVFYKTLFYGKNVCIAYIKVNFISMPLDR